MLQSKTGRVAFAALAAAWLFCQSPAALSSQVQRPPARNVPRTSAISGAVSDGATGRALSGVIVSLTGQGISLRAVTDSKGRFVFRNLPPSEACHLDAEKQGYVADGIARRIGLFNQTPIALGENEWIADVNFTMWRAGGISGVVLDEKGEPVVDVPVRVLASMPIAGHMYWASGAIARTDDRGRYRIAGLPGGRYIVNLPTVQSTVSPDTSQAELQGEETNSVVPRALTPWPGIEVGRSWLVLGGYAVPPPGGRQGYPSLYHPGVRTMTEATPVELGNSEERRNVDFVMSPVPVARISGRVEGPPEVLKGLVVRLSRDDLAVQSGQDVATALVAGDGTFSMANVPAGRYVLSAGTAFSELALLGANAAAQMPAVPGLRRGGFSFVTGSDSIVTLNTRWIPGRESFSATASIAVGGDDVSGVVLPLTRGSTIRGRVTREDGSVLPGGPIVGIEPADGAPNRRASGVDRNGADGDFTVHVLEPGRYFLRAGLPAKSIIVGGIDVTDRPIAVEAGVDISGAVVTLASSTASLSGSVRTATGQSVREMTVVVFPADRSLWTDFGMNPPNIKSGTFFGSGEFRFPRLPAGRYLAVAVDSSLRTAWQDPRFYPAAATVATPVTLDWGKASTLDLVLQRVTLK